MTRAGGRPTIPPRPCLEGILWTLTTGARWKDLPNQFPSYATCWRRFRDWTRSGLWERAWARLVAVDEGFDKLDTAIARRNVIEAGSNRHFEVKLVG